MVDLDAIETEIDALEPQAQVLVRMLLKGMKDLQEINAKLVNELNDLKRMLFGKKSEVMPSATREATRRARRKETEKERAARLKKSKKRREARKKQRKELPVVETKIEVLEEAKVCEKCGRPDFRPLGEGVTTDQYEYVPAKLVRRRIVREKLACQCGETVVTAPAPPQVTEGCEYGPGLHAHTIVAKCADSMPFYRQAKQLERAGIPMNRSTLCTLFHRSADLLLPLHDRLVEQVAQSPYVGADETPLPVQEKGKCHHGYIWTFHSKNIITYVYSRTRSGETPLRILGETEGTLQVDGYTGYNKTSTPEGRTRVGCWAHLRRYFFKALATAPEAAEEAMELIRELYDVEHLAREREIVGSEAHRLLRDGESRAVVDKIRAWLDENKPRHPPKSPIGQAITYAEGQWPHMLHFLDDPKLSIDNNKSERELRIFALGRKNFLFAGNDDCAQNLAILQSLVATCAANDVNPQDYLEDVLIRIQDTPVSRLDELLPMSWQLPKTPALDE